MTPVPGQAPAAIAALIRHGDYHQLAGAPSAHQPFPLNETGTQQARESARLLREDIVRNDWNLLACIDSSRMLRAWQTAGIIAAQLENVTQRAPYVETFDELAERGVGSAANLSIRQIEDILHLDPRFSSPPGNWKSDSRYRLPLQGAETLLEAGERVAGHLNARMAATAECIRCDSLKLFVGHGAAFRHAAYHLGVLKFDEIAKLSMYHGRPVFLEYLGDNRWRHIGGDWKRRSAQEPFLD